MPRTDDHSQRRQLLRDLRARLAGASPRAETAERLSSGVPALDRLLPLGGFRAGGVVEWLSPGPGSGASTLAWQAVRQALARRRTLLVVDVRGEFYPPAAEDRGADLARLVLVRPLESDLLWTVEQALRCRGIACVLSWLDALDDRAARRLQLAAEEGGGWGFFVRPAMRRREPAWSDVRWSVQPLAAQPRRRWRVELAYCRGGHPGGCVELEQDHETGTVHLASPMAAATSREGRSA